MVDRQVRYNLSTTTGEQESARHRWTFMIINEPREIGRIREKIYSQLEPIVDLKELYQGLIESSKGLHYDFFSFSTFKGKLESPSKIYASKKMIKDRDLTERDDVGLERFLRAILEGRKQ